MNRAIRVTDLPVVALFMASGIVACETLPTDPMDEGEGLADVASDGCPGPGAARKILVDASHDGGVWWFPQVFPFKPAKGHQGQALAEHLREQGYRVDELGRGTTVTDSVLHAYAIVIRAGNFGPYRASELDAYESYLSCETTLVLLGEYLRKGQTDPLAERLGLSFQGVYEGTVTDINDHPLTAGVESVHYFAGSALLDFDPSRVTVLGRLDGLPVFGLLGGYTARIFFMGDTNSLETVPQPLVRNLMAWGF